MCCLSMLAPAVHASCPDSLLLLSACAAFLDKLSIHIAKNFLDLPKIKVRGAS